MSLVLLTAPEPLVSLEVAKTHLKTEQDDGEQDDLILAQLAAATRWAEQYTGRAFMPQDWDWYADAFPCDLVKLPLRPLIEVYAVTYYDSDGALQTWDDAGYAVYGVGSGYGGALMPVPDGSYPSTQARREAVKISFAAGYDNIDHPDLATAASAVLLIAGDLFKNREAQAIEAGPLTRVDSPTARALLDPLRVWPS